MFIAWMYRKTRGRELEFVANTLKTVAENPRMDRTC